MKEHWEKVYTNSSVETLGWHEVSPEPSLKLIEKCGLKKSARIFHAGAGASTLIDELLIQGYSDLIANDISPKALENLQSRLGPERSKQVKWIADDLLNPSELLKIGKIDLWHDRAVLHFFTEAQNQESYFSLLKHLVRPGGYAIIAAFNLDGATRCSGLPVFRYNQEMLQERMGNKFFLTEFFNYTYTTPSGNTREYVYTLFHKIS